MSFRIGQKVVVIGCKHKDMIVPPYGYVCHINSISISYSDSYYLSEYPVDKFGGKQSFHKDHLRPVDETFADELEARLKEEILCATSSL